MLLRQRILHVYKFDIASPLWSGLCLFGSTGVGFDPILRRRKVERLAFTWYHTTKGMLPICNWACLHDARACKQLNSETAMLSTRWELQNCALQVHAALARKASGHCPWQDSFARSSGSQLEECCHKLMAVSTCYHVLLSSGRNYHGKPWCRTELFCLANILYAKVLASQQ